jgi:hypothetical protein
MPYADATESHRQKRPRRELLIVGPEADPPVSDWRVDSGSVQIVEVFPEAVPPRLNAQRFSFSRTVTLEIPFAK